jgi:hypothetical protein
VTAAATILSLLALIVGVPLLVGLCSDSAHPDGDL